ELVGFVERTKMNGGWIDGGGDVHQLEAKSAGRKREVANVADERNVGVVDGDGAVRLVGKTCGVIRLRLARGIFFLFVAGVIRAWSCVDGCGSGQNSGGSGRTPYE